jgi:pseudouridine-5'-phosphate glycosidase
VATQQAIEEADQAKLTGRDITPFLLKRIAELTKVSVVDSSCRIIIIFLLGSISPSSPTTSS